MDVQKSLGFLEVQKSIGKIERGSNMKYAYFIDTQVDEERTKNQKLFLLIKDIGLTDGQMRTFSSLIFIGVFCGEAVSRF